MATQRPNVLVALARAGLTVAVAVGLTAVFANRAWLVAALAAAAAPHAVVAFSDARRWRTPLVVSALVVGGLLFGLYVVEVHLLASGLPGDAARSQFVDDLRGMPDTLKSAIVPVDPRGPALLLALLALWTAGSAAEVVARRFDAPLGAVGPSLVLFVAIAALGEGGWAGVTICYGIAVAAYLLVLHHAELLDRRSWFHAAHARRSRVLSGGAVSAVGVVLLAVLVAPVLPGSRGDAWLDYRSIGDGDGGGLLRASSPIVGIRSKLLNDPEREVFTVDPSYDEDLPYWRIIGLDEYDGEFWSLRDEGVDADELEQPAEPPRTRVLVQEFDIVDADPHWLPAAYRPIDIDLDRALVVRDSATLYLRDDASLTGLEYTVSSAVPVHTQEELRAAPPVDPDDFERYLALPDDFPDSVGDLAERLVEGIEEPWTRAVALQDYLGKNPDFTYTLSVDAAHSSESIEEFLFETRAGYCEQYASAFAAMARHVGLPTRIAVGYTNGERDDSGVYHVRNEDAHAWPEVYFTGFGWVPLEPTPGRFEDVFDNGTRPEGEDGAVPPPGATDETTTTTVPAGVTTAPLPTTVPPSAGQLELGGAGADADDEVHPLRSILTTLAVLASCAALVAVVLVGRLVARRRRRTHRRRHAPDPRDRVLGAWSEAVEHLAVAGIERRPSATAVEFALRHAPADGAGEAGPALMELAQLQTAALFAPEPPSTDDATRAWRHADDIDAVMRRRVPVVTRWRRRLVPFDG